MDSIKNVSNVQFQALPQESKTQENTTTPPEMNIENGDEKSMDALKWAGLIGAGTLAAAGVAYGVIKGKGIDAKYVDIDKAGKATLNAAGKDEMGKITRWIKGVNKDGTITKGKIVDANRGLVTKINDGKRVAQVVTKNGKKIDLEYNADNKLIKQIQDGVTTTFEYGTEGATKGKLIKKTVGKAEHVYKYGDNGKISEILVDGKPEKTFTWGGAHINGVPQNDELLSIKSTDKIQNFTTENKKLVAYEEKTLDGKAIKKQKINRDEHGNISSSVTTYGDNEKTTYKIGSDEYSVQRQYSDGKMHKTETYGDKTVVQIKDESGKTIKTTLNGEEINPEDKKTYELIGLDKQKYNEFLNLLFPID